MALPVRDPRFIDFDVRAWIRQTRTIHRIKISEWTTDCPLCGRPRLVVNVASRAFRCLGCPLHFKGLDLPRLVRSCHPQDLDDVILRFSRPDDAPVQLLSLPAPRGWEGRRILPKVDPPPWAMRGLSQEARAYLEGRRIPVAYAEELDVHTLMPSMRTSLAARVLQRRILVPVVDLGGRRVSWVTRALDRDAKPKVLNHPAACQTEGHDPDCTCHHEHWGLVPVPRCASGEVVLGASWLRRGERAIWVEGITDVLRCGPGFVAGLGSDPRAEQVAQLVDAGVDHVVLLLDGDAAGRHAEERALELMAPVLEVRIGRVPLGEDPGSLGRDACLRLADAALRPGDVRFL